VFSHALREQKQGPRLSFSHATIMSPLVPQPPYKDGAASRDGRYDKPSHGH
jgi:hypothetical protein